MERWHIAVIVTIVLMVGGTVAGVAVANHNTDVHVAAQAAQAAEEQREQAKAEAVEAAAVAHKMHDMDVQTQKSLDAIAARHKQQSLVDAKMENDDAHAALSIRSVGPPPKEVIDNDEYILPSTGEPILDQETGFDMTVSAEKAYEQQGIYYK